MRRLKSGEKTVFGKRLEELIDTSPDPDMSQRTVAFRLGVNASTITAWKKGDRFPRLDQILELCELFQLESVDWLIGLEAERDKQMRKNHEYEHQGIGWLEQVPESLPKETLDQIKIGIEMFHLLIYDNLPMEDVTRQLGYTQSYLYSSFKMACATGCFRLTSVPRDPKLEDTLQREFNLSSVIVASLPDLYDSTLVRADLVAFLAATEALYDLNDSGVVGIGPGYTIARLAELSIPSNYLKGVTWTPLCSYAKHHIYSANSNAQRLATRHPWSHSLNFPFVTKNASPDMIEKVDLINKTSRNARAAFITVSGIGRKSRQDDEWSMNRQLRTSDSVIESTSLQNIVRNLDYDQLETSVWETLGVLLNHRSEILGKETSHIDLSILRDNVYTGNVWIVAARSYKAVPIIHALQTGIANALVVDSEIAERMLEIKEIYNT